MTVQDGRLSGLVPTRIFSSAADAPRSRRPTDWLLLFGSVVGLALITIPAPGPTAIDTATAAFLQSVPGLVGWFWEICYGLLLLWALALVVLPLVRPGRRGLFVQFLVAGCLGFGLALLAGSWAGTDWVASLDSVAHTAPPAVYLGVRIAIAVAVVVTASPHMARPLRFIGRSVIVVGAVGAVSLGVTMPSGVAAGFLVGFLVAALVHLVFGSPGGRLTPAQVELALSDLGLDVTDLRDTKLQPTGVALMTGERDDGSRVLVKVYGRDAWDGQFLTSAWSALWTKGESPHLGMGRLQQVEHEAFLTLLAERGGVAVMPIVVAGNAAEGDALLVSDATAQPLSDLAAADVDDRLLTELWCNLLRLHDGGVAHGRIDNVRLVVRPDGTPALADFGEATVAASRDSMMCDRSQLMVSTALLVGRVRAVAAAKSVLGADGLVEMLPFLQPAVLDRETRSLLKAKDWDVAALRQAGVDAVGVEPPELARLQRVTWSSAIKTALIGLLTYAIIAALDGLDVQELAAELKSADWTWVFLAFALSPAIQFFQAFSTIGASVRAVRFAAVLMLQYAIQFIALVIPSSAARVALEIRFFQSFGIPAGGATSIGLVDSLGGFTIQVVLLLVITVTGMADLNLFGTDSGSSSSSSSSSDSGSGDHVLLLLLVLALVGFAIAWFVPTYRGRIKGAASHYRDQLRDQRSAAAGALAVLRHPSKVGLMFGGNLAAQVLQAIVLGICLKAFGYDATLAELILINTGVSLFAGFMPVPGGMGVAEAGYIAGLQAIGIPSAAAMSTAITFRLVTFYLPPIWGGPAMHWLRRRSYV
ncbi:MAG: lysylphosphatidylglycerol synthase transmembrane domain-containing protein [Actinomycetes bacterium]